MAEVGELRSDGIRVVRVRRRKRIGAAIIAASLAAFASTPLAAVSGLAALAILGGLIGSLSGLLTIVTAGRDPGGSHGGDSGTVSLHDGWLAVHGGSGDHVFDAEQVEGGWIEEGPGYQTAVMKLTDGTLVAARFGADQRSDAEALLQAVGANAKAIAMKLHASSLGGRGCATSCLFFAVLFGLPAPALLAVTSYLILTGQGDGLHDAAVIVATATLVWTIGVWLSIRALSSSTVTIGSDGLWIQRRLWRRRFVPFEQLTDLRRKDSTAQLELGDDKLSVRCLSELAADTLIARIEEARDARVAAAGTTELFELERGDRTLGQWRQHLAQLLERGSRYRSRALRRDDLLRVAEDPGASPERRVGAVVAMATSADDAERKRLRIAAEACAHRPLRVALERAIDGEIEAAAMEEAMRTMEATRPT